MAVLLTNDDTLGAGSSNMSPEQLGQWIKSEIPAMAKVVKDEKNHGGLTLRPCAVTVRWPLSG